jgi:iron complex outermembrane receptor protein
MISSLPRRTSPRFRIKALSLAISLGLAGTLANSPTALAAGSQATQARDYAIGPGPLANVLAQFAAQAGVPLSFAPHLLDNRQSTGLHGHYGVDDGFAQLLAGSGYSLIATGNGGYTLVPVATQSDALQLGATTVTDVASADSDTYAGGQVARGARLGVMGDQAISDVPFSVTSYTAQTMRDQQALTVGDVLLNDASVRQSNGFGNFSQMFIIRGLPLNSDDIAFNGLYGVLPRQIIGTESLERVELFKGSNAFLNGVSPGGSGIGGSVNLQPKRAEDTPTRSVTLDYTDASRVGGHLDLGKRFGENNEWGARVNLAQREGEAAVDREYRRTVLASVALDYRGERLRVVSDFGYQKQRINAGRSVVYATGTGIPDAPSARHNWAQDWAWSQLEDTYGMLRAEYDLNDNWTAYAAVGAKHTRENGVYSSVYVTDELGTAKGGMLYSPHDEDNKSAMAGLNGHFDTGAVSHKVNVGLAGIWAEQRSAFQQLGTASRFPVDFYDTQQVPRPTSGITTGGDLHDPAMTGRNRNRSVALADTLGLLDERVLLTVGLRRQEVITNTWSSSTGIANPSYAESITTPVYGLVIKPWEHVSFYANRIEGLAQGASAPGTAANPGAQNPPARSKQIEAGMKVDMGSYGGSLGAYRIEQPASATSTANIFGVDGKQRNRGVELNVFGEPLEGLRLLGGATWMNAELEKTASGANDGNRAAGVPRFQYNLGADWDVPGIEGAALNARLLRTGGQYVNAQNTLNIPAWTRVDLGARYRFKMDEKEITLRANLENVANKAYWAAASTASNYLTQGEPRTLKVSATLDF